MNESKFPAGWDAKRVRDVIAHYEQQTEEEEFAEIEAAIMDENITMMAVPNDRVAEVPALLAKKPGE